MRESFWASWWRVVAVWVALMSGVLALAREVFFAYRAAIGHPVAPNQALTVIGHLAVVAFILSVGALWFAYRDRLTGQAALRITGVAFDPNGPTEFYVDFKLSNPGDPTIFKDWGLSVFPANKPSLPRLVPRAACMNNLVRNAWSQIEREDLTTNPLPKGAEREGRLTFTFLGRAEDRFPISGTRFIVVVHDVRGNATKAEYRGT